MKSFLLIFRIVLGTLYFYCDSCEILQGIFSCHIITYSLQIMYWVLKFRYWKVTMRSLWSLFSKSSPSLCKYCISVIWLCVVVYDVTPRAGEVGLLGGNLNFGGKKWAAADSWELWRTAASDWLTEPWRFWINHICHSPALPFPSFVRSRSA